MRPSGALGERVLGCELSFDIEIRMGSRAYVCGEDAKDEFHQIRKSHENPAVVKLHEKFLSDGPCGRYGSR
jgi:hypothetical protein